MAEYILVDEFQDINRIQYDVVKMLASPENNLFIVGDDDQSIYGFRGSKPEIMLNFEKDYENAKRVVLDVNYRSTSNIVNAAARVIAHNKVRFDKDINTVNEAGDKVRIMEFKESGEQYEKVVSEIRKLPREKYSEVAILFRTNAIAIPMVRKLAEYNIPFTIKDGVPNIFDHWIAKDIITYMIVSLGSRKRSDILQIINRPKRYVGRDYLGDEEVDFGELEKYYEDKPWMIERLDRFQEDLKLMSSMNPYAMINYLRRGVGYDDFLKEYAENHKIEVKDLYNTLDEIMDSTKNLKTHAAWFDYIEHYTAKLKESYNKSQKEKNRVSLMTMHGSKGLEFDRVYIIDACEGITPYKKAVFDAEIEEERRMFYVAMTRARKELGIFYPLKRYNKDMDASRFVREIMDNEEGPTDGTGMER